MVKDEFTGNEGKNQMIVQKIHKNIIFFSKLRPWLPKMFQVKTFIFRWNLQFNYFSQTAFHFYSFLLSLFSEEVFMKSVLVDKMGRSRENELRWTVKTPQIILDITLLEAII